MPFPWTVVSDAGDRWNLESITVPTSIRLIDGFSALPGSAGVLRVWTGWAIAGMSAVLRWVFGRDMGDLPKMKRSGMTPKRLVGTCGRAADF